MLRARICTCSVHGLLIAEVVQYQRYLASSPGSFPLSTCGRKEPGNIGGFKPLTSGGSDNQIAERNHVDV